MDRIKMLYVYPQQRAQSLCDCYRYSVDTVPSDMNKTWRTHLSRVLLIAAFGSCIYGLNEDYKRLVLGFCGYLKVLLKSQNVGQVSDGLYRLWKEPTLA
jgi:hypothetical protein